MIVSVRAVAIIAVACLAWRCGQSTAVPDDDNAGTRILFIGNSLTYTNDLPSTVAAIARSAGAPIEVGAATAPNTALIDHINGATNALQLLAQKQWDFVVLQQGPTTTPICRDSLVLWTQMFDPYIKRSGARAALFMTWPTGANWPQMPTVHESFGAAARAVNGIFIPAGDAWSIAHNEMPALPLYGLDDFHPSEIGSFLAALVIYETLTGRDVRTLPHKAFEGSAELPLSEALTVSLQSAAHIAVTNGVVGSRVAPGGMRLVSRNMSAC